MVQRQGFIGSSASCVASDHGATDEWVGVLDVGEEFSGIVEVAKRGKGKESDELA